MSAWRVMSASGGDWRKGCFSSVPAVLRSSSLLCCSGAATDEVLIGGGKSLGCRERALLPIASNGLFASLRSVRHLPPRSGGHRYEYPFSGPEPAQYREHRGAPDPSDADPVSGRFLCRHVGNGS